jgi:hypothetical protein
VPDLMFVANWHYVDSPGVAGATYGMQQQKSAILAGRAMAGLGVVLNPKISIGVSLGADYNSNTLDAPYIFQQQPVLKGLKTLLDLHTTGYGWNGSVAHSSVPLIRWNWDLPGNPARQLSAMALPAETYSRNSRRWA